MSITVVAAVNDDALLARALRRSPDIVSGRVPLICRRGAVSAAIAYNGVLDSTASELLVFAHQDVYLPAGWIDRLLREAEALSARDPRWAVLGVYGVTAKGIHVGRVWSGDLDRELVGEGGVAGPVASLDELLLVLRRRAGLRFDPSLPHFHLYGTDIVQAALAARRTAHVIDAPVIHDTVPVPSLAGGYTRSYRFIQRKWRRRLPIQTTMGPVTRSGLPLLRARIRHWWHFGHLRNEPPPRVPDVVALARQLGYE